MAGYSASMLGVTPQTSKQRAVNQSRQVLYTETLMMLIVCLNYQQEITSDPFKKTCLR